MGSHKLIGKESRFKTDKFSIQVFFSASVSGYSSSLRDVRSINRNSSVSVDFCSESEYVFARSGKPAGVFHHIWRYSFLYLATLPSSSPSLSENGREFFFFPAMLLQEYTKKTRFQIILGRPFPEICQNPNRSDARNTETQWIYPRDRAHKNDKYGIFCFLWVGQWQST